MWSWLKSCLPSKVWTGMSEDSRFTLIFGWVSMNSPREGSSVNPLTPVPVLSTSWNIRTQICIGNLILILIYWIVTWAESSENKSYVPCKSFRTCSILQLTYSSLAAKHLRLLVHLHLSSCKSQISKQQEKYGIHYYSIT